MEIQYQFIFQDGQVERFDLTFDDRNLALLEESIPTQTEPWMVLAYHQCPGCSLPTFPDSMCPVAVNLGGIVHPFQDHESHTPVTTQVIFRERKISQNCTLQKGLSSMMGLVMATSGCPLLDMLRPMAYTHQPFATLEETFFRAISVYLVAQYVRHTHDKTPILDLGGLQNIYYNINQVNTAFSKRLRELEGRDANINALVLLDVFAQMGSFTINADRIQKIDPMFARYLDEENKQS